MGGRCSKHDRGYDTVPGKSSTILGDTVTRVLFRVYGVGCNDNIDFPSSGPRTFLGRWVPCSPFSFRNYVSECCRNPLTMANSRVGKGLSKRFPKVEGVDTSN